MQPLGVGNSWPGLSLATGFHNSHATGLNVRVWHSITNSGNLWLWMLYLACYILLFALSFVALLFPLNIKKKRWTSLAKTFPLPSVCSQKFCDGNYIRCEEKLYLNAFAIKHKISQGTAILLEEKVLRVNAKVLYLCT